MKTLEETIEEAYEELDKGSKITVSRFAIIYREAKSTEYKVRYELTAPCHAAMHIYDGYRGEKHLEGIITCIQTKKTKEGARFLDYLFNRSPFKDAYLTKDVDEAYTKGILMNIDSPYEVVGMAAIVTRNLWENSMQLKYWIQMVDAGVHEDMALIACHIVSGAPKKYAYTQMGDGHKAFAGSNVSTDFVENFLENKPRYNTPMRKHATEYGSPSRAYGDRGYALSDKSFISEFLKTVPVVEGGFGRGMQYTETLDAFIAFLKKRYAEIKGLGIPQVPIPPVIVEVAQENKKGKELYLDYQVIQDVCKDNGFELKEIIAIRKRLREIIPIKDIKKHKGLMEAFEWVGTEEGYEFWYNIFLRIKKAQKARAA